MEPSWHPDGIKNRCQLRKIIFVENLVFPKEKTMILKVLEVEAGTKNPLKKELNLGRPLGIDFSWISLDF